MDIGDFVREARTRRGLTLQQIAQSTKVPLAVLEHIEHNRFDRLPGAIFIKGYLRAIAAALGEDGERLVQEYNRQVTPAPPAATAPVPHAVALEPPSWIAARTRVAISLLALGLVLYFARTSVMSPADTAVPITDTPTPVATSGVKPPEAPVFAWPMQMDLEVSGDCWVSATVDGKSAIYRLVRRGERISLTVDHEVVLRVGDPTVFSFTLNHVPGRRIGTPGAPATVRINRDTYPTFLQSPRNLVPTPSV